MSALEECSTAVGAVLEALRGGEVEGNDASIVAFDSSLSAAELVATCSQKLQQVMRILELPLPEERGAAAAAASAEKPSMVQQQQQQQQQQQTVDADAGPDSGSDDVQPLGGTDAPGSAPPSSDEAQQQQEAPVPPAPLEVVQVSITADDEFTNRSYSDESNSEEDYSLESDRGGGGGGGAFSSITSVMTGNLTRRLNRVSGLGKMVSESIEQKLFGEEVPYPPQEER